MFFFIREAWAWRLTLTFTFTFTLAVAIWHLLLTFVQKENCFSVTFLNTFLNTFVLVKCSCFHDLLLLFAPILTPILLILLRFFSPSSSTTSLASRGRVTSLPRAERHGRRTRLDQTVPQATKQLLNHGNHNHKKQHHF